MKFTSDAKQDVVSDQLTEMSIIYSIRSVKQVLIIGSITIDNPKLRIAGIVASLAMHVV